MTAYFFSVVSSEMKGPGVGMWLMVVLTAAITTIVTIFAAGWFTRKKICKNLDETLDGKLAKAGLQRLVPGFCS